jgi:hypothetical protein
LTTALSIVLLIVIVVMGVVPGTVLEYTSAAIGAVL